MPRLALSGEQYSSIGGPESMPLSGENLNKKHLSTTDRRKHIHPRVNSGNANIFYFFIFYNCILSICCFRFYTFFSQECSTTFKCANLDATNTLP